MDWLVALCAGIGIGILIGFLGARRQRWLDRRPP